jgi:hypothetical protein
VALAAGPEGTEPVAGVISRRADARYSAGRSQVKPRLITRATASVPRKT